MHEQKVHVHGLHALYIEWALSIGVAMKANIMALMDGTVRFEIL